jgi:uncharacterized protein
MRRSFLCCLLLVLPALASAQRADASAIVIGTTDSIWSPTLKEYRKFEVYTPPSYRDTTHLPQKYPVLYLLDGDAHFHSVTGLIQILGTGVNGTFVVPEMIVVAIPNTDRTRDLTPTHVDKGPDGKPAPAFRTTGGMPNFFTFIKSELIPRIESSYRAAPYRMLVGHSLGGIATIDALYTMPETFNAYVAIDPSLWWDNRVLLNRAKNFFGKPGLAGKTLFVGQANTLSAADTADNIHYNSIIRFNRILEEYNKSGLRYGYKYYPDDDHGSVPLIAEYDALRFIFAPYKLNLARALESPSYVKEHFAALSATMGYTMQPPEQMVDLLAHVELGQDTTKAIELFQLDADLYPGSPQGYKATVARLRAKKEK